MGEGRRGDREERERGGEKMGRGGEEVERVGGGGRGEGGGERRRRGEGEGREGRRGGGDETHGRLALTPVRISFLLPNQGIKAIQTLYCNVVGRRTWGEGLPPCHQT